VEVWPDNIQTVNVFIAMLTQWNCVVIPPVIGLNKAIPGKLIKTGLNYACLPEIWRRTKTPVKDRDGIFEDIRIMEDAAMEEMQKE
jgi:hypothetical protein